MADKYDVKQTSWSEEILDETGLLIACGVWMVFAHAALAYTGQDVALSHFLTGLVLVFLPFWHALRRYRDNVMLVVTALIGVWLILSGIVLESTDKALVNAIFIGTVVIVLTARIAYISHIRRSG